MDVGVGQERSQFHGHLLGAAWREEPVLYDRASSLNDRHDFDARLAVLMTGAAVVAYVSTYEGFGLPVVEAMASGAAVITSDESSLPEVAGDAAVPVDPTRVDAIADVLFDTLALDPASRARRSIAARTQAARFSSGRTAAETIAAYQVDR